MSSSAARAASLSILQAPSSSEYSLWTCRCTAPALTRRSCQPSRSEPIGTEALQKRYSPVCGYGFGLLIWVLRHGDAEAGEGKPDADRDLTEKGEQQSVNAGRALAKLGVKLDVCLTSPK